MFKHISVIVIVGFISYFLFFCILKNDYKNFKSFYFKDGVVKYPLNFSIKNTNCVNFEKIKNMDNFIFYSKEPVDCENFIYDKVNENYYLIEPGYYYYINKLKSNIILNYNPNALIFYLKI